MSTDISVRGPFFSSARPGVFDQIRDDAQLMISSAAIEAVQFNLDGSIKHPTPYYETQITVQYFPNYDLVHDRGIIYGPWLEGTSRRNATTRFKGYHSFRRAAQSTQLLAPSIVAKAIARHIGALN